MRLVVVATPVEEVGRDHDFDWAVIEPSSMHSIIQTAGRVNRHRRAAVTVPNIVLLSRNWCSFAPKNGMAFTEPGLETKDEHAHSTHPSHDLHDLMQPASGQTQNNALNAALVFDEGGCKTRFAQYDEAATRCALDLALPIIERAPGLETGFMRKRYAKAYPLRDGVERDGVEPFHYEIDANEDKFWSVGYPKDRRTATWHAIPQNTWLCLGVDNSVIQASNFAIAGKFGIIELRGRFKTRAS